MSTAQKSKSGASRAKSSYEHREDSGTLFYDAPGVPTMTGQIRHGKTVDVTAEPAVDKNQRSYVRIMGDGVSGGLFVNDRKEQEKHPDFTGPIEINGDEMRMSAWEKTTQNGKNAGSKFLSIALSPKQARTD